MSDEEREPQHGLVMPFVVCESQGGPFDDDAFVAGFRCGAVDRILDGPDRDLANTAINTIITVMSRADELPQLDLIAMRHGYTMTASEGDDEWHVVTFARTETP